MSLKIENCENGVVALRISGKLNQPELAMTQRSLAELLADGEKASILVDGRDFEGWSKGDDWGDLDAQYLLEPMIRKMAIVVDPKWETLVTAFTGKGIRRFPIEIFTPSDFTNACEWLAEA